MPQVQAAKVKKSQFQVDFELSSVFTSKHVRLDGNDWTFTFGGPALDVVLGDRVNKYLFLGLGIGYHTLLTTYQNKVDYNHYLPLYGNIKIYIPVNVNFLPYLDFSLGYSIGFKERYGNRIGSKLGNGLFLRVGLGFDIKRINVGAGYELLHISGNKEHIGFIKLGYRL